MVFQKNIMKLEKFNEKEFYEKYIEKDVLEASNNKELKKFTNSFLTSRLLSSFLSRAAFSSLDFINLTFLYFSIFLSFLLLTFMRCIDKFFM